MIKLSSNLKRILSGLAHQDAGEFLSMGDKMKQLGVEAEAGVKKPRSPSQARATQPAPRRIAMISDGRGLGAPLDYAIDAGSRQGARIDLLVHGAIDTAAVSALEQRIRAAGLACERIQLGVKPVADIIDYVGNHPALVFMVAMPDDAAAKVLMEEVIPGRESHIPVPLVLIEDRASSPSARQSAA